jgi:hypothetical protein
MGFVAKQWTTNVNLAGIEFDGEKDITSDLLFAKKSCILNGRRIGR